MRKLYTERGRRYLYVTAEELYLPVEALRPFLQGIHRLLDLLLMSLVEDRSDNLLHPHPHLPAYPFLLLRSLAPLDV